MNPRLVAATAVLAAATLTLSACGSSGAPRPSSAPTSRPASPASAPAAAGSPAAAPPSSSSAAVLTIKDFGYSDLSVPAGATVTVKNEDQVAHTVTSDQDGLFNVNVPAGASATFVAPGKAGRYALHCLYHGNMHGVLVVT